MWLASCLCLALSTSPSAQAEIRRIEVWTDQAPTALWKRTSPFQRRYTLETELGDSVRMVKVEQGEDTPREKLRIRFQYQTSLALGDEGPHLDLLDWKHCTTAWQSIADPGDGHFDIPPPTTQQASCFPSFGQAELLAAVRAHGGEGKWITLAKDVSRAGQGASYVAPSLLRMQVQRWDGAAWVVDLEFDVPIAMGC
ncbi:hypothetical protein [Pseudoxanthomonas sp. USHLN014]|uniref:hypothetical protein n=1 Tax=Pseudoxanthomonas sp. USHLN014 TaxID=3081297 RepID=UPI00301D8BA0